MEIMLHLQKGFEESSARRAGQSLLRGYTTPRRQSGNTRMNGASQTFTLLSINFTANKLNAFS